MSFVQISKTLEYICIPPKQNIFCIPLFREVLTVLISRVLIVGLLLSSVLLLLTAEAQHIGLRALESSSVWEKGKEEA